jgi:hypothetical protein
MFNPKAAYLLLHKKISNGWFCKVKSKGSISCEQKLKNKINQPMPILRRLASLACAQSRAQGSKGMYC